MKSVIFFISVLFISGYAFSQPNIYPAPENKGVVALKNATIHVGNGQVIQNGTIIINGSKIEKVGSNLPVPADAKAYDLAGKQVYPGLISPITNLGIRDVNGMVPGTDDYSELGDINPSIRAIVAYNTDNHVINVLRNNGILLANVIPQHDSRGSQLISGTSTVVQLDAWNWEDAAYKMDGQMHINMPSLMPRRMSFFGGFGGPGGGAAGDPQAEALKRVDVLKNFFKEAKFYIDQKNPAQKNLNFEATRGIFDRSQKLFIHCNGVKEMLVAIDFAKEFNFDVVIVGGADSWQIAPLLKENNIPVILSQMHSLPQTPYDDVDQPFKTPAELQKAGVLFAISDVDGNTRGRNLVHNAGTAAAYGLTKEQALTAITLNSAKILGIDKKTGSIEEGKDANIVVCKGDILDLGQSIIEKAFIQGREVSLDNKQSQLAERYEHKYNIKLE